MHLCVNVAKARSSYALHLITVAKWARQLSSNTESEEGRRGKRGALRVVASGALKKLSLGLGKLQAAAKNAERISLTQRNFSTTIAKTNTHTHIIYTQ